MPYRVTGSLTYSSANNGNNVRSALQSTITSLGLGVLVTVGGTGATVTVDGTGLTEDQATTLLNASTPNWSASARSAGHFAVVRED